MERQEVALRIKKLRSEKKMSQNELANYAGISPTYISQLERGEKSPTIKNFGHVCWGLGITIEEFFATEKTSSQGEMADKLSALTPEQKHLLNIFLNSL